MTAFTDYLLAAWSAWLALLLWRHERQLRQRTTRFWFGAFLATAIGAAAGGGFHGGTAGPGIGALLWKTAVMWAGMAAFLMVSATAFGVCRPRIRIWLIVPAALELALYGYWMVWHDGFRYVVFDYASAMLVVLLFSIHAWLQRGERAAVWIGAGIFVSFAGVGVEAVGWPVYSRFNHDALYHLVQAAALYLFYRGATLARDR